MKTTTTIAHKFDIDDLGFIEVDFEAKEITVDDTGNHPDDPCQLSVTQIEVTKINRVFFEVGDSICALDLEPYLKFRGKLIDKIEKFLNENTEIYYNEI